MKNKSFPRRYVLVFGAFLLSLFLYIDRACISAAKGDIASTLHLTDTQMGWVLSFFALGYALMQTPAGLLVDRFGPRRVLTGIVAIWSVFTALTGAAWNYISLLVVRFLFGAGEAGAFPSLSRAFFTWIPMQERGIVQGINFSGSRLGAAFALPAIAWLISAVGWRHSFMIQGAVVFSWALVWYLLFRDLPEKHRKVSQSEKEYILTHRQQMDTTEANASGISISRLFGSRNMWMAMLQYFCSNFTFFFCLTWLMPHLKEKYALEFVNAGMYASVPLLFGAFGNWVSGWLVDRLYKAGHWQLSRRLPAMIGFGLAAVGLVGSANMESITGAVVFLSLAIFGADMTLSPSWAFCIDVGKRNAGAVSGTMNMAGNIGSFLTALAFPYIKVWTGSVMPFFYTGAALAILAVAAWALMNPKKSF